MALLLDTCTFLWLSTDQSRLSERVRESISSSKDNLFVMAMTAFEISALARKGRIRVPMEVEEWFRKALKHFGVRQIPLNFQIAAKSDRLPGIHGDPMDRMLIATAQEYQMTIVTPDQIIQKYPGVDCLW